MILWFFILIFLILGLGRVGGGDFGEGGGIIWFFLIFIVFVFSFWFLVFCWSISSFFFFFSIDILICNIGMVLICFFSFFIFWRLFFMVLRIVFIEDLLMFVVVDFFVGRWVVIVYFSFFVVMWVNLVLFSDVLFFLVIWVKSVILIGIKL